MELSEIFSRNFKKIIGIRGVVSVGAWAPTDFWELLKGTPWAPTDVFGSKTIGHPQIEIPDYATELSLIYFENRQ